MIVQLTAYDTICAYPNITRVERTTCTTRFFSRNAMHDCRWSFTPHLRPDYPGTAGRVEMHCTPLYA